MAQYKYGLSVALLCLLSACKSGVKEVNFSLPVQFSGFIVVSESARAGQELISRDNKATIVVPASGNVVLASMADFTDGVNEQFYIGKTKLEYNNPTHNAEAVEVEDLGRNAVERSANGVMTGGEITFIVGNLEQRRKLYDQFVKHK